ncbi:MAG: hypothetical protein WD021_11070 [Rhodothermales bacterium]
MNSPDPIQNIVNGIRGIEDGWKEIADGRQRALLMLAEKCALRILAGADCSDLDELAKQYEHQRITAVCARRRTRAKRLLIEHGVV